MIYAQSKQIKYHNTMMKRHTYGKARNGNENGNWKLETGNWKLEKELETEMEMQSSSCCSPSKIHVLLAFVPSPCFSF